MQFSYIIAAAVAISAASATPKKHSSSICTTTLSTLKTYNLSPVTTVYLTTHTATASVDCHGCSLTEVGIGGPGPVRPPITATLIDNNLAGTTTTTVECSPSIK